MKKITLLTVILLTFVPKIQAQCDIAVPLPYQENFDAALPPDLPDCTYSYKQTFVGNDWEAVVAPNSSFSGNVARYSTITDAGWSMACSYFMRPVQLTAGINYKVSYKYALDTNETALDLLRTSVFSNNQQPEILLATHMGITGTEVTNYSTEQFTVPATDTYYLRFDVESLGNQGIIYLDDIKIEEMGVVAGIDDIVTRGMACYPNPVKDQLTVTNTTALEQLELYTTTGQLLIAQSSMEGSTTINLENLPAGVYFLKAKSGAAAQTIQVIKQ